MNMMIVGGKSKMALDLLESRCQENIFTYGRDEKEDRNIDLLNYKGLPKQVKHDKIRYALILAGITSIREVEENREIAYLINHKNTTRLIEDLNNANIRCLFPSTTAVFGLTQDLSYEDTMVNPANYYGELKAKTEEVILRNRINCVVRLTKVITRSDKLLNNWMKLIGESKKIEAFNDVNIAPISSNMALRKLMELPKNNANQSLKFNYYQTLPPIFLIL